MNNRLPTIRKWWTNHWQVLGCPCGKPPGQHHYSNHAEAIQHIDEAYAGDFALMLAIRGRRVWREIHKHLYGTPSTPAHHTGRSFLKEQP